MFLTTHGVFSSLIPHRPKIGKAYIFGKATAGSPAKLNQPFLIAWIRLFAVQ